MYVPARKIEASKRANQWSYQVFDNLLQNGVKCSTNNNANRQVDDIPTQNKLLKTTKQTHACLQALRAIAPGPIKYIVVTHSKLLFNNSGFISANDAQ